MSSEISLTAAPVAAGGNGTGTWRITVAENFSGNMQRTIVHLLNGFAELEGDRTLSSQHSFEALDLEVKTLQ